MKRDWVSLFLENFEEIGWGKKKNCTFAARYEK